MMMGQEHFIPLKCDSFVWFFEKQFLVASRVREIMNLKSKPNEKQYPNYQELYVGQFKFADSKKYSV